MIVGNAEAAAHHALAFTPQQRAPKLIVDGRLVREGECRGEIVPILRIEARLTIKLSALIQRDWRVIGLTLIRSGDAIGKELTQWSRGYYFKTIGLVNGRRRSPSQAVGKRQIWSEAPNVLRIKVIFLRVERAS